MRLTQVSRTWRVKPSSRFVTSANESLYKSRCACLAVLTLTSAMACEIFLKICHKCKRKFVQVQVCMSCCPASHICKFSFGCHVRLLLSLQYTLGSSSCARACCFWCKVEYLTSGLYKVVAVASMPDIDHSWDSKEWIVSTWMSSARSVAQASDE